MTAENGAFTVKSPSGDQVLHWACVITRAAGQLFIRLMRFLYLLPVQLNAKSWRVRNSNFSVLNLQRIFGQAAISLLPNPVGIDGRGVTRRRRADVGEHGQ